ncbi:MAG: pyoverdine chromophore precursor synthetase [Anaerolineae bacterium]|mgnify:CR=1 FL=1|jgi:acyl-CoA synthetase (AMP-forming)/AMP-acid ligase II|nr:MAG: pyoverdine chromophore precursor synthetase [Anaerolineae bacterium]
MTTIPEILRRIASEDPQKIAVVFQQRSKPDQVITYQTLYRNALRYGKILKEHDIHPDEVVIIVLQHSVDLIYAFFGAMFAGAIPSIMPFLTEKLSPEHYRKSLRSLFEVIQPVAVITYKDFEAEIQQATQNSSVRKILIVENLPTVDFEISVLPGFGRPSNSIVLLQHSSGTTGLQKGVALSHQAVMKQLTAYQKAIHLNATDVIVSWLPLYHDMGLIAGFLMPILLRVPLVLMSPFDWVRSPVLLLRAIHQYQGTLTWLPNFAYNFCAQKIRSSDLEGIDLSSLRAVINCSEPMMQSSHEMFLQRFLPYGLRANALATCYAMAENVFAVSQDGIEKPVTLDWIDRKGLLVNKIAQPRPKGNDSICMVSAGKPLENTQVRILNEKGEVLPERVVGEIALKSDCMLSEYYKRPDLTHAAFLDGWYLTGDLGYIANGEIYITGRKKDLIIVGGKNIYPQDIERIVAEVPGVYPGRVVAFGIFNEEMGTEEVVVVAETEEQDTHRKLEIADQICFQVNRSSDIVLRKAILVERGWLLKTSSGKIARSANREKYLQEFQIVDRLEVSTE